VKPILLIDSHYICYRAMFTLGDLRFEDKGTGVIFGFLRQIQDLAVRFDYPQFIFAWDSKRSYRRDVYPEYKRKDKELAPEMAELLSIAKPQFPIIRTQVLPKLGFNNNLIQSGCEADDLIAQTIIPESDKEIVIVSSDNDLYQLLEPNVKMWNVSGKHFYTDEDFKAEWGIDPEWWAVVKAIAGCDGDNIKGVPGVGYPTAIKYLKKELLKGVKFDAIQASDKLRMSNYDLVYLPHPKTRSVELLPDTPSFDAFEEICMEYGFTSMLKKGPYEIWQKILH
jgi:DNA polymerase-1